MPLLLHAQAAHQGRVDSPFSEARLLSDIQFGDYTTYGFGASALGWGLEAELPFGPPLRAGGLRFEYQPSFAVLFGPKLSQRNGAIESQQYVEVHNQGLIWVIHRLAAEGGYKYASYWAEGANQGPLFQNQTYTLHRSGWAPDLGVAVRDAWAGRPGRFYASYVFPTGCLRATFSNPCVVQSPGMHGVEMMEEIRATSYLRVGVELAAVRYYDPSASDVPGAPRIGRTGIYANIRLKFEWPANPLTGRRSY